ncbi:endo alpha-1,4 polygalactosaminidase [Aeromicrobium ginsengisoli]|uniref:endo alpha-1,4 polygalactosaminidase n=1 Tax=Aeromicrobium ginsengisoli TaxID=363867 RepID=UPI001CB75BED|nr:endo alpha-1,4 polygalactosaminidase [Aeromicrobium ginsengisoli]
MSAFLAALVALAGLLAGPPVAGVADYQLGGAYTPDSSVQIVTRDRTAKPAEGTYSICYVNAFQTQPGSYAWWKAHHPKLLLRNASGNLVRDPGWPDEVLLDIRTPAKRATLARIVGAWFETCAADGFQGTEPDNLDSWTRSRGLLSESHAVAFAKLLVRDAHRAGLAIAQKNTPELSAKGIGFDFAVAEECEVYRECGAYTKTYGRRVIEIEYTDNGRAAYRRACAARAGTHSIMLRDRDVVPRGAAGYVFQTC